METKKDRIEIVNKIIESIANRGRHFFKHQEDIAFIFEKKGKLYMKNEYNKQDMYLHTKFGYPPKRFHHGGTLWALTKDFKEFIQTGKKTNHNNGYGGLYCSHWGYDEAKMKEIQEISKDLGYL